MWCPRCKAEYVDGYTRCADCNVALANKAPYDRVEHLEAIHRRARAEPWRDRLRARRRFGVADSWRLTRGIYDNREHRWRNPRFRGPDEVPEQFRVIWTIWFLVAGVPAGRVEQARHLGRITGDAVRDARPVVRWMKPGARAEERN